MATFRCLTYGLQGEGRGRARPACAIFVMLWLATALARGGRKTLCSVSYSFPVGLAQCESQSLNILKTSQQLRALPALLE